MNMVHLDNIIASVFQMRELTIQVFVKTDTSDKWDKNNPSICETENVLIVRLCLTVFVNILFTSIIGERNEIKRHWFQ